MADVGKRDLLSLRTVNKDELHWLVDRTVLHAAGKVAERTLAGHVVGLYFAITSTRTRTAFTTGAQRLGAHTITYGPGDLQLNTGETTEDTGRVLATMLDALVVRAVADSAELSAFSSAGMAVINAMSTDEHPTQAIADLATMQQRFGRLDGLRVLYLGEGNSTAVALCHALGRYAGTELLLRTPPEYGLPDSARDVVTASPVGSRIEERHDVADLPAQVDIVYTTRWQTTGTTKRHTDWRARFAPFQVDEALMDRYPEALFMHDLPAHRDDEVTAAVLDGPRSVIYQQAANKLYSAMAALEWCLRAG